MKKVFPAILILLVICMLLAGCSGAESPGESATATFTPEPTATPEVTPTPVPVTEPTARPVARELTEGLKLSDNHGVYLPHLLDCDADTWVSYYWGSELYIESSEPMASLYLCWFRSPGRYTVRVSGGSFFAGETEYLYEYIQLPFPTNRVELAFEGAANLCDVRAFTKGETPEYVQRWQPPLEQADVLVFPTHADDETVFFGGLIADCVDRGISVQVAYMVSHLYTGYNGNTRPQELLNALWELGVHNYPVFGPFQDQFLSKWDDAEEFYGMSNVIGWQVEQLRRFKPLVAVGHDRYGEYGHAAHMMNGQSLESSVKLSGDKRHFGRSADTWGVWTPQKLYLHFAPENQITLDLEHPLEHFGGRTAFEVACDAMQFHKSQLKYKHRPTLDDEDFPRYDCRLFGLVRSSVGEDTGSDIMENTYRDEPET